MNIKKTIKEHGWTLESLRAKMQEIEGHEVKQTSMSRLANSTNPTIETLQRLARAMDISILDFFNDERPSTSGAALTCPHCGKRIGIKLEKEEG